MTKMNYHRLNRNAQLKAQARRDRDARHAFEWKPIGFGQCEGLTIPELVLKDPGYFYWMLDKGYFRGKLEGQARLVANRAAHLSPPAGTDKQFAITEDAGGFLVRIRQCSNSEDSRKRPDTSYHPHLSLKMFSEFYSAKCRRLFREFVMATWFGSPNARPTAAECERFFEDDTNFDLTCRYTHSHDRKLRGKTRLQEKIESARANRLKKEGARPGPRRSDARAAK